MAISLQKVQAKVKQIKVEGKYEKEKGGNRPPQNFLPEMENVES